jgi:hypothetical protein
MVKPAGRQPKVEVIRYGDKISAMLTASVVNRSAISWEYKTLTPRRSMPSTMQTDKEENRKICRLKQPMVEESVGLSKPFIQSEEDKTSATAGEHGDVLTRAPRIC